MSIQEKLKTAVRTTLFSGAGRTWSQFGEDIILASLLHENKGTYVDVGAGDPRMGSNTYKLYRRGWSGVLVEPNARMAERCRRSRKRDFVVEAVVTTEEGWVTFFEYEMWQISTIDELRAASLQESGISPKETHLVRSVSLASLSISASPEHPTLLAVDAEGSDLDVLVGNDWTCFQPRVICVEDAEFTFDSGSDIDSLLRSYGYRLVSRQVLSSIYCHGTVY